MELSTSTDLAFDFQESLWDEDMSIAEGRINPTAQHQASTG